MNIHFENNIEENSYQTWECLVGSSSPVGNISWEYNIDSNRENWNLLMPEKHYTPSFEQKLEV